MCIEWISIFITFQKIRVFFFPLTQIKGETPYENDTIIISYMYI